MKQKINKHATKKKAKEKPIKYLFVCLAGVNRSPTAALYSRIMAARVDMRLATASFGVESEAAKRNSPSDIRDYMMDFDRIFVMEEKYGRRIRRHYHIPKRRIENLDIPDDYSYWNSRLIEILDNKLYNWIRPNEEIRKRL